MLGLHRGTRAFAFAMACLLACSGGGFADEAERDARDTTQDNRHITLEFVLPKGSAQQEEVAQLVREFREMIQRRSRRKVERTRGKDRPNKGQRASRKRHFAEAIEHLRAAGLPDVADQLRESRGQLLEDGLNGPRSALSTPRAGTRSDSAGMFKELHAAVHDLQNQVREVGKLAQSVDDAHRRIDELRDHLDKRLTQVRQPDGPNGQRDGRRIELIGLLEKELQRRNDVIRELREDVLQKYKALAADGKSSDALPFDSTNRESRRENAPIAEMQNALIDTSVALKLLETKLRVTTELGKPETAISQARIDASVETSPSVQELRSQIEETRAALADLESTTKNFETRDRYQRLKQDLVASEESLEKLRERLREEAHERLKLQDQLDYDNIIRDLKSEIHAKKVTLDFLQQQVDEALRGRGASGEQILAFEFAKARLEREDKIYEHIASRIAELRAELDAGRNRIDASW